MNEFVKDEDGVHIKHPSGADETLCGWVFSYKTNRNFEETKETVVTCPECAKIIRHLRKVKVRISKRAEAAGEE